MYRQKYRLARHCFRPWSSLAGRSPRVGFGGRRPRIHATRSPKKVRALALKQRLSAQAGTVHPLCRTNPERKDVKTGNSCGSFAKLGSPARSSSTRRALANFALAARKQSPISDVLHCQGNSNVVRHFAAAVLVLTKSPGNVGGRDSMSTEPTLAMYDGIILAGDHRETTLASSATR